MNILQKIQNLSDYKKKIIFWSILIIVGGLLFFFWGKNFSKKIQNFESQKLLEELKLPKFQEEFKNIPQPSKDDLRKLEEIIKEIGEQ